MISILYLNWCSPPMIVRMRLACPGQSTNVNCSCSFPDSKRTALNPRSNVIPRSTDCGFLSKAAVLAMELSARASVVFPLSTCPRRPTLKFLGIVIKQRTFMSCTLQKKIRFALFLNILLVCLQIKSYFVYSCLKTSVVKRSVIDSLLILLHSLQMALELNYLV